MFIRQFLDYESYTYTYLVADDMNQVACLIDPVKERVATYQQILKELGVTLSFAMDTHVHADHVTALGELRELTGCNTLVGEQAGVECVSDTFRDGQVLVLGDLKIQVLYTPGHTNDSYSFYLNEGPGYLFTGDTLLIRGSGRTDFQNGNPEALYESLHNKLLVLPDHTVVFPGHDYKGWMQSTIAEEKQHNPRLLISSKAEFAVFMNQLDLPDPKWMDIAVPANLKCGKIGE